MLHHASLVANVPATAVCFALITFSFSLVSRKMASSTILESTATFEMQATRAGLSAPYVTAIKNMGLGTLGKIAYALTTPGTSPTDAQIGTFLNGVRPGTVPTLADETAMKGWCLNLRL